MFDESVVKAVYVASYGVATLLQNTLRLYEQHEG